jgi:hypothetical protein
MTSYLQRDGYQINAAIGLKGRFIKIRKPNKSEVVLDVICENTKRVNTVKQNA